MKDVFWTRQMLNKVTEFLSRAFFACSNEDFEVFCLKFNIKSGVPMYSIKSACYSNKAVADYYNYDEFPEYKEHKNVVVVSNPFYTKETRVVESIQSPFYFKWLEIDADTAKKFLVLGEVP